MGVEVPSEDEFTQLQAAEQADAAAIAALQAAPQQQPVDLGPLTQDVTQLQAAEQADAAAIAAETAARTQAEQDEANARLSADQAEAVARVADEAKLAADEATIAKLQTDLASAQQAIKALQSTSPPAPAVVTYQAMPGLETFRKSASDTADMLFAAAAAYIGAQTYKGFSVIVDRPQAYDLYQQLPVGQGFGIQGPPGRPVDQNRGSHTVPHVLNLHMPKGKGWLVLPNGSDFAIHLGGLSIDGTGNARIFEPNPNAVAWLLSLRDLGIQNCLSLLGSAAVTQPIDFLRVDGSHNWNNWLETCWRIGGSDCFIKPAGLNLDSPPALLGPSAFLMQLVNFSKSSVSGVYATCDQHSGLLVAGSNDEIEMSDCRWEGRNANTPCFGANIRVDQSQFTLSNSWVSYGMTNPAATGRDDAGLIHACNGAVVELDSITTRRAAAMAEYSQSNPNGVFAYATGAGTRLILRNIIGRGYTGKPVVRVVNGATVDADSSVTVVTV